MFLDGLVYSSKVSVDQVQAVRQVQTHLGTEKTPTTQLIDKTIHMSWDTDRYHFDVEVGSDGLLEWFFRDRQNEELAGSEDERLSNLPEHAIRLFKRVFVRGVT